MKARRTLSAIAAISLIGAATLIVAPIASAAQVGQVVISGGASCNSFSVSGTGAAASGPNWTFTGDGTDTVSVLTSDPSCTFYIDANGTVSGPFTTASAPQDISLSSAPDFCITITNPGSCAGGVFFNLNSTSPSPSPSGGDSSSSSAPRSELQQFGKPAVGTCNEAQPAGLDWGGAPRGGWGVSWAQWMNGGLGGEVCTRSLVYSPSTASWVVN